jgi:2-dehydropantoate 2-reductase
MKVLVYGAGVLGTLFAARLQESGNDVSVLARGKRLNDLRANGLVLEDVLTNRKTNTYVNVVEGLAPVDRYDLIVVLLRKNQVSAILPTLAANSSTGNILFMHNNAAGFDDMMQEVSRERILIGFPGAGGTLEGYIVRYGLVPQQQTMLGELDGRMTPRLQQIAAAFRRAGLPVSISRDVDAWLKTHAAFVTSIAGALYLAGGDNYRLAKMPEGIPTMVRAVREGFKVIRAHNRSVTPLKLAVLFEWLPSAVPVMILPKIQTDI